MWELGRFSSPNSKPAVYETLHMIGSSVTLDGLIDVNRSPKSEDYLHLVSESCTQVMC